MFSEAGDLVGEARLLRNLASVAIDLHDFARADTLLDESRAVAERSGNPRSVADAMGLLGTLAFARGDYATATAEFSDASDRFRGLGDIASVMDTTGDAGYMAGLSGDLIAAGRFLSESLTLALDLEARDRISWALLGIGNLAAQRGDAAQAVRLLAAAELMQASQKEDLRPSVDIVQERILEQQRQSLGEPAYAAAREEGRALSLERAVAEARAVTAAISAAKS